MGLLSWLGISPGSAVARDPGAEVVDYQHDFLRFALEGQTPADLWKTQPNLRTVVSFMARNIAQLGVHTLRQAGDGGRERVKDTPLSRLMERPNPEQTMYEVVYALVSDLALYDQAYLLLVRLPSDTDSYELRSLPAAWVDGWKGGDLWAPEVYIVNAPGETETRYLPAASVIAFHGWSPTTMKEGVSPVSTLRETLEEQVEASRYRLQMWRRGGRVGSVVTRPKDAPQWSPEAQARFKESLAGFGGDGSSAGRSLLLQDGMDMKRVGFSAKEEDFVEVSKLALATVARVFHINPTMVGLLDNANYSNVKEFRRSLYGDTLGPVIRMIEARLNLVLLDRLGLADSGVYVEFNLKEKLRGSFEEQAAVMSASVGGPWMTRNEARARENLPALDGGDELIVPLNVGTPDGSPPPGTDEEGVPS